MDAFNTICVGLLEHGGVRCEIITVICPWYLVTTSSKIAPHQVSWAVLQHVDLARIASALPMVWTHPKRGRPCALAIDHPHVEIELIKIVHAEWTFHF